MAFHTLWFALGAPSAASIAYPAMYHCLLTTIQWLLSMQRVACPTFAICVQESYAVPTPLSSTARRSWMTPSVS